MPTTASSPAPVPPICHPTTSWTPSLLPVPPARLSSVHPGEILREEFLTPLGLTPAGLARAAGMPATYVRGLAHGDSTVTLGAARRLSGRLGTSVAFRLRLQAIYDQEVHGNDSAGVSGGATDGK